jgi:pimeloyl-ACP methyl ester carboxylesterase
MSQSKPSIVFCHGIWADGSCFSKLIPPLRAEGYEVISAQYNLVTGAGIDDRVVGLVYISALAPDEDETGAAQQAKFPQTDVFKQIEVADGRIWMLPSGIGYFCGDLSEEEQQVVWATATPPAAALFDEKPAGAAWKTKPSAYIVAAQDHAVHPDLERFSAERMGATTYEVDSSHVPMLSHPEVVLDAIRNLVTSLSGSLATA